MGRRRSVTRYPGVAAVCLAMLLTASPVAAATSPSPTADLDGVPIPLVQVGRFFCQDFERPHIHCYRDAAGLQAAVGPMISAASVTYVIIYDYTSYQGGYMYLSDNYPILATIGWNDRISSLVVVNGQSGAFWTDWLYSGARFNYCCNVQYPSLGGYDNSFSSVFHN